MRAALPFSARTMGINWSTRKVRGRGEMGLGFVRVELGYALNIFIVKKRDMGRWERKSSLAEIT